MKNYGEESLKIHAKKNVIMVSPNVDIADKDDLSIYYTPGIAAVCDKIAKNKNKVFDLTIKRNTVAVVTDGSAVLGLGNIGPEAALPVMEGKALLFSRFAGIDAFPICLDTQNTNEIVKIVKSILPVFGGINLEDISAPRCFEIERRLQNIGIPVMHDDQHGTAIVVLAGLINALKVVGKNIGQVKIVISGAGAAGTAIAKLIFDYSNHLTDIKVVDSKGVINIERDDLNKEKQALYQYLNPNPTYEVGFGGFFAGAVKDTDVFIGVSAPNILTKEMVRSMAPDPIIFAMANPIPEIDPALAEKAGAKVVATGRSDFPNQINNVLAFPGIFRGALDVKATKISDNMKMAAALALANCVKKPTCQNIIPSPLDDRVSKIVAKAVAEAAKKEGIVKK